MRAFQHLRIAEEIGNEPNGGEKANAATIFTTVKEPTVLLVLCIVADLIVCSAGSSCAIFGTMKHIPCLVRSAAIADGVCGGLLALFALLIMLEAKQVGGGIISIAASIAMGVASGLGSILCHQAEKSVQQTTVRQGSGSAQIIGEPVSAGAATVKVASGK